MVEKQKVLFLCTGNSCRSQMAEGFLRDMASDRFEVYSAGLKPSSVNPLAITAMDGVGVDISSHTSDSLNKYLDQSFHHLITVCDHAKESCLIFPGAGESHHWGLMIRQGQKGPNRSGSPFFVESVMRFSKGSKGG